VGGALDNTAIPDCNPWTIATRHADTGVIVVCEQKIALGRANAGQTLAIAVSGTTLAIELGDDPPRRRTPRRHHAVHNINADRPRTVPQFPRVSVEHHVARNRPASPGTRHDARAICCAGDRWWPALVAR
jgi:hypothetical protein